MLCESELIKTDITAVKLIGNYVLVGYVAPVKLKRMGKGVNWRGIKGTGVGNFLSLYHQRKRELISKLKIFDGHKIHGIELDDSQKNLFLYSSCYMKKLSYDVSTVQLTNLCSKTTTDWILTAKWLKNKNIATVMMLNKLAIHDENLNKVREIICDEKCILYSAFIYRNEIDELVVFSGTVFGEILVWNIPKKGNSAPVLTKLKGHKGVIFSIHYDANSGYLCSSSDDRSTIVWSVEKKNSEGQKTEPEMKCKVYGHQSRVFRSKILEDFLITAGEDSYINMWSHEGKLLRKIETHQGGPIWSIDVNENFIVSGGGDSGVLLTPLHNNVTHNQSASLKNEVLKRLAILYSSNLIVITEKGYLFYYIRPTQEWIKVNQHEELKSYNLLEVSKCRKLFSLSGFHGEIYIYKEENNSIELISFHKNDTQSRIYSFHWLSCDMFFTCQQNNLTLWWLLNSKINKLTTFNLPKNKDIWTTAACMEENGRYIVGDRKGNIYVYVLHHKQPVQIFKKVHNYLGVTKIHNLGNKIISLGRNSTVRTFIHDDNKLVSLSSDKVPLTWLTALVDGDLLAFSGNNFVVWDYEARRILFEYNCGGGHRSWDFYKKDYIMIFAYVKDQEIKLVKCDQTTIYPIDKIAAYHPKTINSMKILRACDKYLVFSGSEDTNLRLSLIGRDIYIPFENLKSHLSSIRSICWFELSQISESQKEYLIFSAGGRGQIVCWKFLIDFNNFEKRVFSEQYSHYEKLDKELSESRIMDLSTVRLDTDILLLAATSEGNISVFTVCEDNGKCKIQLTKNLFHKHKCVTRICVLQTLKLNILISLSTDGYMTLWEISNLLKREKTLPFTSVNIHQSGINSFSYKMLKDDLLAFLTGGDDNKISLNLFQIAKNCDFVSLTMVASFQDCFSHCAQITGVYIANDYFFTTSLDQKLVIFAWKIQDQKLICKCVTKYNTAVADIQGMEIYEADNYIDAVLYGKGIELVKCTKI